MNFLGRRVLTGPESAYVYDVVQDSRQGSLATVTAMVSVSSIVRSSPPAHDQMSKQVPGNQTGAGATDRGASVTQSQARRLMSTDCKVRPKRYASKWDCCIWTTPIAFQS
jgi:hypothetical protein